MKKIIYLSLLLLLTNCKAQHNNIKNTKMKTFDIATFEKNKDERNEFLTITKDNTQIKQTVWQLGYEEIIIPNNSLIYTYNKYYKNGKLKLTGDFFSNDFEKGIWKEYDEQGNLIKETNYDAPYKFTWENVLDFIKKRDIDMTSRQFQVTRGIGSDGHPYWGIIYEQTEKIKLQTIEIDGVTGVVIGEAEEDYPIEDDNMDEFPPPKE